jgi:hypothetical protein
MTAKTATKTSPATAEHVRLIAETLLALSTSQLGVAKQTAEELLALIDGES